MNAISRAIDRFCARHPKFGVPNLMLFIVIGTAAVYLFGAMTQWTILPYLCFSGEGIVRGEIWRLVTFVLVPGDTNLLIEAISLYFYYFIGSTLEKNWGTGKFTCYYFMGMLLTMLYGIVLGILGIPNNFLTASYINLSMFFAFAILFPEMKVLLFYFIPIKIKWLAYLDAALFLWDMVRYSFPANLLPLVAILNFFVFCWPQIRGIWFRIRKRADPNTINFKKAARQVKKEQQNAGYRHKCAVCGRTDTDYPNLQFRYCSRCAGFHCFCEDHIDSHVHFTE